MWLSASGYFYQYWRVYSPIAFPKKTDPNGDYIRKYLPQFKDFPSKFIYEPWKAPEAVLAVSRGRERRGGRQGGPSLSCTDCC